MTQADREAIFEAGAWERRFLGAKALSEAPESTGGRPRDLREAREREARDAFDAGLRGDPHAPVAALPQSIYQRLAVALTAPPDSPTAGAVTRLQEGQRREAGLPVGIHARLAAALTGEPRVAVPEGKYRTLVENLEGGHQPLPKDIYARLAKALTR